MRFFEVLLSWCLVVHAFQVNLQVATQSTSTSNSPVLTPEIDSFINGLLSEWNSPGGISVAVVRKIDDGTWNVETKGYGIAQANGAKVTGQTLFAIGSNSKLFNILSTGLLIANETLKPRISWTTKIASIVPEWGLMDPVASADATIIDLMSHRTGLPRHDFAYSQDEEVLDLIKRFRFLKPSAEFRETWQYSNNMYALLSYLPTAVLPSRPKFARFVKANIFEPLSLNSTTYSFDVANRTGDLADGFRRQRTNPMSSPFDAGIPHPLPFWNPNSGEDGNLVSGAGGVISNAVDMATWLRTLLLDGRNPRNNDTVIPAEAIQTVATGITVETGSSQFPVLSPVVYGGGQTQSTYRGSVIIEHDGSTPGFKSTISRLPFEGIGIALLSNDDDLGDYMNLAIKYRLIDQMTGLPPFDTKSLIEELLPESFASAPAPIPRPDNATLPSGGINGLAGFYNDRGYGMIELCLVSQLNVSTTQSKTCRELAANITTILPGAIEPNVPTFIAKRRGAGAYVRLTHFDGNIFNLTLLQSYPTGNISQPFWITGLDVVGPLAEFAQDGGRLGIGLTGGIWGAGQGVPEPQGRTVKERSEVWFTKV